MDERVRRHEEASANLIERMRAFGFEPLVDAAHRLPPLTTLRLPASLGSKEEAALRKRLLQAHGIEVGGGLGALAGQVWRVGLMGENARIESVDRLIAALESEGVAGVGAG